MLEPLNFQDISSKKSEIIETQCLLCDDIFNLNLCLKVFLKHLFEVHHIVIEDVQHIKYLEKYILHWKQRFDKTSIEAIIPAVDIENTSHKYFLISTLSKEDKELRQKLSLEHALNVQEFERTDASFKKQCLFCRLEYEGVRCDYIQHLSEQHNLQLGNPQNLVYIDELLERIEENLNSLICIYCEKSFPERTVLKEHMRKKIHKRINPQNASYDRFYIINYLEDANLRKSHKLHNRYLDDDLAIEIGAENSDSEYSDWLDNPDLITCLFCTSTETDINKLCLHMHTMHRFNFPVVAAHLDFYQRVKLVNYLRKEIYANRCPMCELCFDNRQDLDVHMREEKHCQMPDIKKFDQPEYYFPTYENDAFLCFLEDIDD